jgi:hypothetical protein
LPLGQAASIGFPACLRLAFKIDEPMNHAREMGFSRTVNRLIGG